VCYEHCAVFAVYIYRELLQTGVLGTSLAFSCLYVTHYMVALLNCSFESMINFLISLTFQFDKVFL